MGGVGPSNGHVTFKQPYWDAPERVERVRTGTGRGSGNSPAGKPHEHEGEIARRKRQAERIDTNRHARAVRAWQAFNHGPTAAPVGSPYPAVNVGLSRSGAPIVLRYHDAKVVK